MNSSPSEGAETVASTNNQPSQPETGNKNGINNDMTGKINIHFELNI